MLKSYGKVIEYSIVAIIMRYFVFLERLYGTISRTRRNRIRKENV